jgi:hypothetical protein
MERTNTPSTSSTTAHVAQDRRTTMKTMFLTLAAVLGIALGTASLSSAAHAAWQYTPGEQQFQPANGGNR